MKIRDTHKIIFITLMCISVSFGIYLKEQNVSSDKHYKIGLLIMATGRYSDLAQKLIESANNHFCPHHDVTYFVFTDRTLTIKNNVVCIPQNQLGWPYDTMMRFATYHNHKDLFESYDYLFACDADMLFVDTIGDEILDTRVATLHPQVRFRRGIYETNPLSTACVQRSEGSHYFAGAFYGGTREEFLKLVETAQRNVAIDLARGYIACINDESHLNRYFIDNHPTTILPVSYCHFESWHSPYKPKLVAFDDEKHIKGARRRNIPFNPLEFYKKYLLS